ncbi:MAG TPA: hypothetical protein VN176_02275 [Verrucomicrobiae bacterium]|jgi:hypothetical protein|nr:hypothetical protein [Verrucomicrobiae bacterium]
MARFVLTALSVLSLCLNGFAGGQTAAALSQEDGAAFTGKQATALLTQVRQGVEGHMQKQMLDAFDLSRMSAGQAFKDQITAFFDRYDSVRIHFHVREVAMEGDKGVALVDVEMELEQRGSTGPAVRKQAQLRFVAESVGRVWKFTDIQPRTFFS